MTRTLSSGVQTAIAAATYRPVFFIRMVFDEGSERACTAPYSIWFDDGSGLSEYIGVGALGTFSAIEEGSELRSYGMSASLSGALPEHLSIALNSRYQGRQATVWLGFLDAGHVLIADPIEVFRGIMDTMPIELGQTGSITVTIENALARWENPNPRNQRYTDADQRDIYPGDRAFEFTNSAVAKELVWGRA
ncbi:MAG: hypothetical protein HQL34_13175 [Alphaproteobacteria bacterium]|nr:hypothetical protein [Alphaproteobacteria bacterium]